MDASVEMEAMAPDRRKDRRFRALFNAQLKIGDAVVPVKLLNLSTRGAMLESECCPVVDTKVVLMRGSLRSEASVAWVNGQRVGLQFDNEIPQLHSAGLPTTRPSGL
jgi:hypothetical protein